MSGPEKCPKEQFIVPLLRPLEAINMSFAKFS